MEVTVSPSLISGKIKAPASKSCSQRALAVALLTSGISVVENVGQSNDEQAALRVIQQLGATVHLAEDNIEIESDSRIFSADKSREKTVVDCGESGLSMRMFAGIAALFDREITLTGSGSILSRPMDFVSDYLPQLDVKVASNHGKVPLKIHGPIRPKNITVDGSLSSQFLTGLLFAYCKAAKEPVTIHVSDLTSRPYIDLTIDVLGKFGFRIRNNDYQSFDVLPVPDNEKKDIRYRVEGDWSNAAFLLVGGAIAGGEEGISLTGMDLNSTQGDKKVLEALEKCGAALSLGGQRIHIAETRNLSAFDFDATQCPDLFPPLVALAARCGGITRIAGVHRLLHKESNRSEALKNEFEKMNVRVELEDDNMLIYGGQQIKGARVSSHNDHRIAMATAITALRADGETVITGADAINKSYPGFYDDIRKLGGRIS